LNETGYRDAALDEHRFWLQILGDHARFIYNALSSAEVKEVQQAQQFMGAADNLLEKARRSPSEKELEELTRQTFHLATYMRTFKLELLRRHLVGRIRIDLAPTFLNHMVNEVEEYLCILNCLLAKEPPPVMDALHHHLLWLQTAAGHAAALNSGLDETEAGLREKTRRFQERFKDLYHKAEEIVGYTRTNLLQFPALHLLNQQAEKEMSLFREFLQELEVLNLEKKVLGAINPLMPDHMTHEACYYLLKLSMVAEISAPGCDPAKPRISIKYE
jgi:hypothetical protein